MKSGLFLGIDIGSTTLKAVLLFGGKVHHTFYERTQPLPEARLSCTGACERCGRCNLGAVAKSIDDFLATAGCTRDDVAFTAVTGSQIVEDLDRFIEYDTHVSEISAHVAGARHYYPGCKAVLDVGGQDSKAMLFHKGMDMWTSRMSGVCAAGTGAFLDSVAVKLNVPVEEMADKVNYDSDLEVSSTCAVLSATSVNKFKNRHPLGDVIAAACRAQARTVMSGVGELFLDHRGPIIFQGGVASNRAVAYYLHEITGNEIVIPEFHQVMGALGAARLAQECARLPKSPAVREPEARTRLQSVAMRASLTRREFLSNNGAPMVWRNLFFPPEILNALGVRMLTLETYAALRGRSQKHLRECFDAAASKGYSAETCSFLRVLEGDAHLPRPDYVVSTTEPCQQGERVFADLVRSCGANGNTYTLHTPYRNGQNAVEHIASGLEEAVERMEKALDCRLDPGRLAEACDLSNQARELSIECNEMRFANPPLVRGADAILFATIFSQLWGKPELVKLQRTFRDELEERRAAIAGRVGVDDTHRLVWLHLPPFYSRRLMDFVEETCQAPIVFEEVNFTAWDALDPDDPYRSLARRLLTVGFLDPELRVRHIRENSGRAKVSGYVLYNHGFGRCSMSDSSFIKHLREDLHKIQVPLLVLDGDCMDETIDPCSTYTKVSAFVEALNLRKYGTIFAPSGAQSSLVQTA